MNVELTDSAAGNGHQDLSANASSSRRTLHVFLTVLLLTAPAVARGAGFLFTTNNSIIAVKGYVGPGGEVTLPERVGGLPIRQVAENAFSGSTNLTGITIPDSVTSIGDNAFRGCGKLTRVAIGRGVTKVGVRGFSNCESLPAITIPNGVSRLGDDAFWGCSGLTNVTLGGGITQAGLMISKCRSLAAITVDPLNPVYSSVDGVLFNKSRTTLLQCPEGKTGSYTVPGGVTHIGTNAFADCVGLTHLTIPDGVTAISWDAFIGCAGLTSVKLGRGIASIGDRAFRNCSHLTDVTMGNNVARLGLNAFADCISLTQITLSDSLTNIGTLAFSWCTSLATITIPDNVTSIGADAFRGCSGLTNITIGRGATNIASRFSGCSRLVTITVDPLNPAYSSPDGVLCNKNRTRIVRCPEGRPGSCTIPESITSIGDSAFADCVRLTRIQMPDSITNIGVRAFAFCTGLGSLTIPNQVTVVEEDAFRGCTRLTNLDIGRATKLIKSRFTACHRLETITVNPQNASYGSADGVLFNKNRTRLIQCPEARAGSYTVPEGVTSIESSAFADCIRLTNITICRSVTNLGSRAFSYCERLLAVAVPDRVETIGDDAFRSCTSLTNITIGRSVISLGKRFAGCLRLTTITVDPLNASYGSLDGVLYDKGRTKLIQCPESKPGGCTVPESVTSIAGNAFADCALLTNITLAEGVTNIGPHAFSWCAQLTAITLPATVRTIGSRAFESCPILTRVNAKGDAPSAGSDVFDNDVNVTVYYRRGTKGWGSAFAGRPATLWVIPTPSGT